MNRFVKFSFILIVILFACSVDNDEDCLSLIKGTYFGLETCEGRSDQDVSMVISSDTI